MADPIDSAINAEHSRQERAWNERMTNKTTSAIDLVERVAEALANQIAMRKGCPPIRGCLALMPSHMAEMFRGDARAAIEVCESQAADTITRLQAALAEARLQLEYLDERFPTGTTPAILARIKAAVGGE